jgi:hypothetical protein
MKLIGTVLGFDIGTGAENDNDFKMDTDTKKETNTSTTTTTTNKTNEHNKNLISEKNQVRKYFSLNISTTKFLGGRRKRKG